MKKPIFKCWREDWEIECQKKKDPVNKAKFERKYKGLKFYDFDHENRVHYIIKQKGTVLSVVSLIKRPWMTKIL